MIAILSIQAIELLFTTIALFGLVFSFINLRRGFRLVNQLKKMGLFNGRMRLATFGRRQEAGRALIQAIFVTIGTTAFFLPPGSNDNLPLSWRIASETIRWGLILVAVIISLKSYDQWNFQRTFKLDKANSNIEDV